jgi:hypothetical protein
VKSTAGAATVFRRNREARVLKKELAAYEPAPHRGPRRKVLRYAMRRELNEALVEYDYEWQPAGKAFRMIRRPKPYAWPIAFIETVRRQAVREARRETKQAGRRECEQS